ncbi:metallophosphoesterase family protein [Phycisphaeraceae bacterium D3-23]
MTRLGLLSDSHGDADITRRAVDLLLADRADLLIHLGDVNSDSVLDALAVHFPDGHPDAGGRVPVHVVFGNTDYDTAAFARYAADLGLSVDHPAGRLSFDGKRIAFTHGHLDDAMHAAIADGCDYLLHGHTHLAADNTINDTRVICPGALTRASPLTAAILDLSDGKLDLIEIPGGRD